jgi:NAD(P)-dependent dehydrogenase (short-subunit alcohol dehydrogenase family)
VTDPASVAAAAQTAADVGVLINNAGIAHMTSVLSAGAIVNVSSVLAWLPVGGSYGVTKAALWNATDSMRIELAPRGVQVVGVYVGLVDTDMAAFAADSPKSSPAEVVRQVLDGIESRADEVLADETTRQVRAQLATPIRDR